MTNKSDNSGVLSDHMLLPFTKMFSIAEIIFLAASNRENTGKLVFFLLYLTLHCKVDFICFTVIICQVNKVKLLHCKLLGPTHLDIVLVLLLFCSYCCCGRGCRGQHKVEHPVTA